MAGWSVRPPNALTKLSFDAPGVNIAFSDWRGVHPPVQPQQLRFDGRCGSDAQDRIDEYSPMKFLVFSPFSGIWEFSELEARLASALKSRGHEIVYVTCEGVLRRHCIVMALNGLATDADDTERDRICKMCKSRATAIRETFDLRGPNLGEVLDPEIIDEIDSHASDMVDASGVDSVWRDVPVGRRSLFPFLAYKKRSNLDLSGQEWIEYRDQLQQSMLAVSAAERLIQTYRPDAVITYSSTYAALSAFREMSQKNGVPCFFVEAGGNLAHRNHKAIFAKESIRIFYEGLRAHWHSIASRPVPVTLIREVTDHLAHTFSAKSVFTYSEPSKTDDQSIRERFSVPSGSRVLVATMSSYDEVFAAQQAGICPPYKSAFNTQIEWIRWLCQYVAGRDDLFLIIRVHPREFPNRRERVGKISDHAQRLREELDSLPPNCVINWPTDKISLYDLAKETDVVLNAWSSAGKELGLLGIPVVEWISDLLFYPPDDELCATNPDDYGRRIELALGRGWNPQQVLKMYRWHVLEYGLSNFGTTYRHKLLETRFFDLGLRAVRKIARRISPFFADAWFASRQSIPVEAVVAIEAMVAAGAPSLAHIGANQGLTTKSEEAVTMARELRRLVSVLFGSGRVRFALHQNLLNLSDRLELSAQDAPKP
jgi:hypothetical protein